MRIFLTGSNGQVGFELERQLCLMGEVAAPRRQELDLSDESAVAAWLDTNRPQLIVNAAAFTAVDKAETELALAKRLNTELPAQLAAYCSSHGVPLVHYSSDYVYPGNGEWLWQEDDTTGPLSAYGQTKLEGDQAITASGCRHLIFRTSWVYSARGNNFMKTMLRLGRQRDELKVVSDQIGAPTPARLIAQVTHLALERQLLTGIYHLAPRGETSWHGFAREIFKTAADYGESLTVELDSVKSIPTSDYPTPATRPLNSRLSLDKLEQALGLELPEWQGQLKLTLQEYLA